jgi:PAS domain S-box-containing protein
MKFKKSDKFKLVGQKNNKILKKSGIRLENTLFFMDSPLMMAITDLSDGKFIEINKSFIKYSGFKREEVIGKTCSEIGFLQPETYDDLFKLLKINKHINELELTFFSKEGFPIQGLLYGEIVSIGVSKCFLSSIVDITKIKQSEQIIEESEKKYKSLFNSSRDGIVIADEKGQIIDVNDSFLNLLQCTREELISIIDLAQIKPEKWIHWEKNEIRNILHEKDGYSGLYEREFYRKDGTTIPVEINIFAVYENNGHIKNYCGIIRDISERKKSEKALLESQEMYKLLADNSNDSVALVENDNKIIYFSKSYCRRLGYTDDEIANLDQDKILHTIHPDDEERVNTEIARGRELKLLRGRWDYRTKTKNGNFIWVEDIIRREFDSEGNVKRVIINSRDITDRKLAEVELQKSRDKLDNALKIGKMGYWEYDLKSDLFLLNDNFFIIFKIPFETVGSFIINSKQYTNIFIHPEDVKTVVSAIQIAIESKKLEYSNYLEHRTIRDDGSIGYISVFFHVIADSLGNIIKAYGLNQDITEIKLSINELRESKEKYKAVADYTYDWEFWIGIDKKYTYISPSVERITGYKAEDFYQNPEIITKIIHPDDLEIWNKHITKRNEQETKYIEFRIITKNDEIKWINHVCQPIYDSHNNYLGIRGSNRDITKSMKEKMEIMRSAFIIEQSIEEIMILSTDRKIKYINDSFSKISGYTKEEVLGRDFIELNIFSEQFVENISKVLSYSTTWTGKVDKINKAGKIIKELLTISPVFDEKKKLLNYVFMSKDIMHEEELENQLRQAQKMEALGTLAGGIAHDFNNILASIMGFTEILLDDFEHDNVQNVYLEKIYLGIKRATGVARQILSISRKNKTIYEPIQINMIIKESLKLLRASIPSTIEIRHNIREVKPILGDPTQIHQILMNLVTNSKHAMKNEGGIITIELNECFYEFGERVSELPTGRYIVLKVSDTGKGIEPSMIDRIFEPYFTTKEIGEGTGLGLAIVHGIVKNHKGDIFVESEINKGTSFSILLPVSEIDSEKNDEILKIEKGKGEKILVVDDEVDIVEMLHLMLNKYNYNVIASSSSLRALELFKQDPNSFDLVISDMTMPGIIGSELSREIRKIREDIPILICTGYSDQINEETSKKFRINNMMKKPIEKDKLLSNIRKLLNKGSSNSGEK